MYVFALSVISLLGLRRFKEKKKEKKCCRTLMRETLMKLVEGVELIKDTVRLLESAIRNVG